jgi:Fic family protein
VLFELGQCESILAAISEMPIRPDAYQKLQRVALVKGAQATTAIEGNTLSESEIERVVDGKDLPPSKEYQEIEVRNILDAMNTLLNEVVFDERAQLIDKELLLRFHTMIGKDLGPHFDAIPGRLREDARIVGHYRCPDHRDVPELTDKLCSWLRDEFNFGSDRQSFVDAITQAIVSHVYIEWIHPFGDGNGRTGRLVEFYILLRAGVSDIASHVLSSFYNLTRPEYYRQLEIAGDTRDLSGFIAYAVKGFRDGLKEKLEAIQADQFRTAWTSYVHDKFAGAPDRKNVFKRRRDLALSLPLDRALSLDEIAVITPQVARAYAGRSLSTLVRDLKMLIDMQLVVRTSKSYCAYADALRGQMPHRRESSTTRSCV